MEHQGGGRAAAPRAAPSASQPPATESDSVAAPAAPDPRLSELSRLFIVCGRDRKVDELRALFSTCGTIKHLHLALDRSKKSRGFAFLQYEDPANAVAAIEKLDHLKLDDGHILKVTVAKERPVGGNGKLKRGQHARQDLDEKAEGGLRDDDGGLDARLPGKRQRSSPPVAALPLGPSRVSPAFLLDKHRLEGFVAATATATTATTVKNEALAAKQLPAADTVKDESMDPDSDLNQVDQVMRGMLAAVEQGAQIKSSYGLFAAYRRVMATPNRGNKKKRGGNLLVVVPESKEELEEESSTDSLASSIRSVSLASTPMTIRGSPPNALWTPRVSTREGGMMPPPRSKHHLRRRRQSLDGSGSSTEDGSDASGIRRKRSNTTTSPPATLKAQSRGNIPPLSPPRKNSDRSDISLSPDALKAEIISKKLCKRQSSDNTLEESFRVTKHQATRERHTQDSNMIERGPARPSSAGVVSSCEKHRSIKLEFKSESPEPARTKLFFTSTYKFTEQELEAMFAVYGDFESVELVKSFGRVKTMAYVRYTKSSTAAFVVKSFCEESSQGDESPEKNEFMTLSFAHDTGGHQLQPRDKLTNFHAERSLSSGDMSCSLPHENTSASSSTATISDSRKDRLWVLLLYDRFLATHMLSSVVSSFSGMEFVDIKVVKSTGEAQGVAFVKFDCETNATQAALQLHQMELPLGSGKFLQAIVILAPSLFTTTHGGNSISTNDSMRLDRTSGGRVVTGSSEDVDLRAVEARFAHLMRSTEHQHSREGSYFPQYSMVSPREVVPDDAVQQLSSTPSGIYPPSHSASFHTSMGMSAGVEYYPMQLVPYPPVPQQPFQPYANYGGPASYQQVPQHQSFGGSAPGWMNAPPYYQGGVPQYPFSCTPEQEMAFPVVDNCSSVRNNGDAYAVPPKPRSSLSSSEQMDIEDGSSSCSSQASSSIHVSTSEPLELVTLVNALQGCPGVVSFTKDANDLTGYTVDFANEAQALEAARKLDGLLCGGQTLRVAKSTSTRQRGCGGGSKARSGSGRRKRQRVDPRSRK